VPRDRNGDFTPQLVRKGSRRLGGLDEMIISLYAGGMTLRDIQHHLVSTIGTELSHETISKITDQVADEVVTWQRRPLEALYPVIYLDALVVKVKDGAHVRNKAAHIAVGVDVDGIKYVLGISVQTSDLSCIGLVTTFGEVVEDGLGWFGDARWCGDLLAAEADGR
jgi:transposase-like protein